MLKQIQKMIRMANKMNMSDYRRLKRRIQENTRPKKILPTIEPKEELEAYGKFPECPSVILTWKINHHLKTPNVRMHWSQESRLNKTIRDKILKKLPKDFQKVSLPCIVILERISPRSMDDDNLTYAFKHIRDVVADLLIPGLASGRADGDRRIKWDYRQSKGGTGIYAVKITIAYDMQMPFNNPKPYLGDYYENSNAV